MQELLDMMLKWRKTFRVVFFLDNWCLLKLNMISFWSENFENLSERFNYRCWNWDAKQNRQFWKEEISANFENEMKSPIFSNKDCQFCQVLQKTAIEALWYKYQWLASFYLMNNTTETEKPPQKSVNHHLDLSGVKHSAFSVRAK